MGCPPNAIVWRHGDKGEKRKGDDGKKEMKKEGKIAEVREGGKRALVRHQDHRSESSDSPPLFSQAFRP